MAKMLDGRAVLITGAARGIGRAHARTLAEHGARVVMNDLHGADEAAAAFRADGHDAVSDDSDVGSWQGAERAVRRTIDAFGGLDGLVNNAGVLRRADIADLSEAALDLELHVNLKGAFACTHHASAYWRSESRRGARRNAAVVHTASDTIFTGSPGGAGYAACKAAIVALAQSASLEGAHYGVRHNVICPSGRTTMAASSNLLAFGNEDVGLPEEQDPASPENPMHNSPIVVWLLSDRSAHVTGQVFRLRFGAFSRMAGVATQTWHCPPAPRLTWDPNELGDVMDARVFGCRFPPPMREFPDGTSEPFARFDHS
jgi:NAD(P)-dependent dehydrogenase (short-subunit alcohol dehydrogenase family)